MPFSAAPVAALALALAAPAATVPPMAKPRRWVSGAADDGSVHAMGNGQVVVYGQGPNVVSFFGPPLTSPGILTIATEHEGGLEDEATREPGTAVWQHKLRSAKQPAGGFTELVAAGLPAYVRLVECKSEK